jgi:hypothetical protein
VVLVAVLVLVAALAPAVVLVAVLVVAVPVVAVVAVVAVVVAAVVVAAPVVAANSDHRSLPDAAPITGWKQLACDASTHALSRCRPLPLHGM